MIRSDRAWTAVVVECGLDRAQPVLALLQPAPFGRVNLARALSGTGLVPERAMPFADLLQPALADTLGDDGRVVFDALADLPFDDAALPATTFWRAMCRNLTGKHSPDLPSAEARRWADWLEAFRGRVTDPDTAEDWVRPVIEAAAAQRALSALAKAQRRLPMTAHDRSLYVRFGWNDDGAVAGLAGLVDAGALRLTQRAWATAAPWFDTACQTAIETAAAGVLAEHRKAALANLDADARRYSVPRAQLAAELYPEKPVPPLQDILTEAAR
ncbi:MAG: hypothetical protein ABI832_19010 [bacterium]